MPAKRKPKAPQAQGALKVRFEDNELKIKVKDADGNRITRAKKVTQPGRAELPNEIKNAKIKRFIPASIMVVETDNPGTTCYMNVGGKWYKVC